MYEIEVHTMSHDSPLWDNIGVKGQDLCFWMDEVVNTLGLEICCLVLSLVNSLVTAMLC